MARAAHINGRDIPPVGEISQTKPDVNGTDAGFIAMMRGGQPFGISNGHKEANQMAIEFGSRKEIFDNFKVYETTLAGRP